MAYATSGEFITKNELGNLGFRFTWSVQERTYEGSEEGEGCYIRWNLYTTADSTYSHFLLDGKSSRLRLEINGGKQYVGGGNYTDQSYIIWNASGGQEIWSNPLLEYVFIPVNYTTGEVKFTARIFFDGTDEGVDIDAYQSWDLQPFARGAKLIRGQSFTDEQSPVITYSNPAGERVTSLQACISLTGAEDDVEYRDIPKTGTTYTFDLEGYEKQKLWESIPTQKSRTVVFYIKTVCDGETFYHGGELHYTFSVVNANPVFTSTVEDINTTTKALTGGNSLIKGYNTISYDIGAIARKGADIVSRSLTVQGNTYTQAKGQIQNLEEGVFVFSATDSRGLTSSHTITLPVINYFPPTVNQELAMHLDEAGGDAALIELNITGNVFNATFGSVRNTIKVEVRHSDNDGNMGSWVDLTPLLPEMDGNTYSLHTNITGLKYDNAYTFQCRATDKLNNVITDEYTISLKPVFDWGKEDFAFNVPVTINGDLIVNGTVTQAGGGDEVPVATDYIVNSGTASMGSNGTWYWRKWSSGRADCYGARNYGNMAVTTTWGGLYRSEAFSQALPSGLFVSTPEVIDIVYRGTNYGGWVARHESSSASSSNSGGFIIVRPASATLNQAYIGFNVIGRWK